MGGLKYSLKIFEKKLVLNWGSYVIVRGFIYIVIIYDWINLNLMNYIKLFDFVVYFKIVSNILIVDSERIKFINNIIWVWLCWVERIIKKEWYYEILI